MEDSERKAVVDQMGSAVGAYLSAMTARNLPGAMTALAAIVSGVGLLAQETLDFTEELQKAS